MAFLWLDPKYMTQAGWLMRKYANQWISGLKELWQTVWSQQNTQQTSTSQSPLLQQQAWPVAPVQLSPEKTYEQPTTPSPMMQNVPQQQQEVLKQQNIPVTVDKSTQQQIQQPWNEIQQQWQAEMWQMFKDISLQDEQKIKDFINTKFKDKDVAFKKDIAIKLHDEIISRNKQQQEQQQWMESAWASFATMWVQLWKSKEIQWQEQPKWFFQKVWENLWKNLVWWISQVSAPTKAAIAQLPESLVNVWNVINTYNPFFKLMETMEWRDPQQTIDNMWNIWSNVKKELQDKLWVDPKSFSTKSWEFILNMALSLIPVLPKWWLEWTKIVQYSKQAAEKYPALFNILKTAMQWWVANVKFQWIDEWKIEWKDFVWWALIWWTLWTVWEILKKWWKIIYWMNIRPSSQDAEKILEWKIKWWKEPLTIPKTSLESWISWTRTWVAVKWWKMADTLWKTEVEPLLEKWKTKINIKDIFDEVSNKIDDTVSAWEYKTYKKVFENIKKDYFDKYKTYKLPLNIIQKEKSRLDKTISNLARQQLKWSPKHIINNFIANEMRSNLHNSIFKEFWVNSADKYMNWFNLTQLKKIWKEAIVQWPIPTGWSFVWIRNILDTALTPITTYWWKVLYKVWNLLDKDWEAITVIWYKWLQKLWEILNTNNKKWQ